MAQYLTVLAAAQYLGVSREKLSRLIKTGKLTPVINKLDGRERLIPLSQLDALKIPGQKISGSVKQVQEKVTNTTKNQLKNVLWLITNLSRKEDKNMAATPALVKQKCSFCGKAAHQVSRLVAGPNRVFICDECVRLANQIIQEDLDSKDKNDESSSL